MGLDMYLYKKMYVGNDYKEPKDQVKIEVEGVKQERVSEIVEKVGYWRKANQIHNWFINNCTKNGEDDCKEMYVNREQLEELLKTVNLVLDSTKLVKGKIHNCTRYEDGKPIEIYEDGLIMENDKIARELLPTQEGFFFGNSNYDQYYYENLQETKKLLEEVLKETDGDFYYKASW